MTWPANSAARALAALALCLAPLPTRAADTAPPLIPRTVLFGNPSRTTPSLSPDGKRLAYLAPDAKGVQNVWIQTLGKEDAAPVSRDTHRTVNLYRWAEDSRHILYEQDSDGDENWHVYSIDLETRKQRDLTPFKGVKAQNLLTSATHPDEILVGLNRRNPRVFDMFRIRLSTGEVSPDTENPGDVLSWTVDSNFVIRAATAFDLASGRTVLRIRASSKAPWRDLSAWAFEDSTMFGQINGGTVTAGFAPDGQSLYVVSAQSSDTARLVRMDANTGREVETLAEDPRSDVAQDWTSFPDYRPLVLSNPATHRVEAVAFQYLEYRWTFLDPRLKEDFDAIAKDNPGFLLPISRDRSDEKWIVSGLSDHGSQRFLLYDRRARSARLLFVEQPELDRYQPPRRDPVEIQARDGLKLVGYLTLPQGVPAKNLPLVLVPHGGPWARDDWGSDPFVQFLANRGYAVLQVNFRGSTGFGKKFLNAGNHQFGLGMQEDLHDGVRWAIRRGIADPKRVGILGASAGGYATLRGITTAPDLFACAVDLVGPTDLKVLFSSMPSYWGAVKTRWIRRMGDVENDDALNRSLSPLYHVDRIRVPILIGQGANDPRVNIKNSDLIVKALRDRGLTVTYVVYPDEGHGFARPENNLDFSGRVEEFLAKRLGGRFEPWKKIEGATAQLR